MKRLILCLFFLIAHFLAQPSQSGPLRSLVQGCPGGACPTKTIKVPVEVIVAPATEKPAESSPEKVWGIIGDRPGAYPTCPRIPVYGWIEQKPAEQPTEKAIDEAASRLARGGLSREEEKKLAAVIDAPAVAKARNGHYSPGTCGMLGCGSHPGHWVWDDEESQAQTDAKTVPWGGGGGRLRRRR